MPARSVSWAISGENGAFSTSLMVRGSTTSTWSTRGELRLAERALHRQMALEREFGGFRVERLAVLELHAGPQLDGDVLAVGGGLVRQRELRHDVELLVDVEQLVAEGGEHDAADIGARQRGIENVGVLGEADAQRGLGAARLRRAKAAAPPAPAPNARSSSDPSLSQRSPRRPAPTISTPARRRSFRRSAESGDQFLQCRRKAAVVRHDARRPAAVPPCDGRPSHGRAVVGEQCRRLGAAAVDDVGAAGMEAAARRRIERARQSRPAAARGCAWPAAWAPGSPTAALCV